MYLTAGHGGSVADGDIVTDAVVVTDGMRDVLIDAVELADTPLLSETVDDAVSDVDTLLVDVGDVDTLLVAVVDTERVKLRLGETLTDGRTVALTLAERETEMLYDGDAAHHGGIAGLKRCTIVSAATVKLLSTARDASSSVSVSPPMRSVQQSTRL